MSQNNSDTEVIDIKKITEKSDSDKSDKSSKVRSRRTASVKKDDSSKSSVKDDKPVVHEIDSDDIDVSQMELIANKKKLTKKPSEVDNKIDIDVSIKKSTKRSYKKKSKSDSSSSSSSSDTKIDSDDKKKKRIEKENNNEYIRKEKSELLYKFSKIRNLEKWSSLKFDMTNSLEEIKNEFDRVTNAIKVDRSVNFLKRMLLLGVQGVEMLNNKFDPFGVDLDGWGEAMSYNMENQDYDDVMTELYEKYKSAGEMSPEVKLIFMIVSSAAFFTISKKLASVDSQGGIMNFLGNMMNQKGQSQQTPQGMPQVMTPQQQQLYQQQLYQQQMQQQQMQQQQMQQQMQQQQMQQQRNIHNQSETSEDNEPSKMNDPQKLQDTIALNNILDTMKKRQSEKKVDVAETSVSEIKTIPSMISNKKRGRPTTTTIKRK